MWFYKIYKLIGKKIILGINNIIQKLSLFLAVIGDIFAFSAIISILTWNIFDEKVITDVGFKIRGLFLIRYIYIYLRSIYCCLMDKYVRIWVDFITII
jgi:hypothetical protein